MNRSPILFNSKLWLNFYSYFLVFFLFNVCFCKIQLSDSFILEFREESTCCVFISDELTLKAYLSPTVVKAIALEKIDSNSNTNLEDESAKNEVRLYSVVFQIKKIYKLEDKLDPNDIKKISDLYRLTESENSKNVEINSLILVNEIMDPKTTDNCRSVDIQLKKEYILFLNKPNESDNSNNDIYEPHSINMGSSMAKRSKIQQSDDGSLNDYIDIQQKFNFNSKSYSQSLRLKLPKNSDKMTEVFNEYVLPVRLYNISLYYTIPLFKITYKPAEANSKSEQTIKSILCPKCEKAPRLKPKQSVVHVVYGESVRLECEYDGNPQTLILWNREGQDGLIELDERYRMIERIGRSKSQLKIYDAKDTDNGVYYCFSYNYLANNGSIAFAEIKLVVTESPFGMLTSSTRKPPKQTKQKPTKSIFSSSIEVLTASNESNFTKKTKKPKIETKSTLTSLLSKNNLPNMKEMIICDKVDDLCQNNSTCFISNSKKVKNKTNNANAKKLFCQCKENTKGEYCEIITP